MPRTKSDLETQNRKLTEAIDDARAMRLDFAETLPHSEPTCHPNYPVNPWTCAACASIKEG